MADRKRRHNSLRELRLFNPHTTDGIDQPRRISREEGEQMVAAGTAVRRFDTFNNHTGYNLCAEERRGEELPIEESSRVFSSGEVKAIIGVFGRSRTARLSEAKKLELLIKDRKRRVEDLVERSTEKLVDWPLPIEKTTPDKAVRVYPKKPGT